MQVELYRRGKRSDCAINKFDPSSIISNSSICMIAKRGSGKTVMVKDLIHKFNNEKMKITVFSPTDKMNKDYSSMGIEMNIYERFDLSVIKDILEEQKENIEKKNVIEHFIVMDDCLADKGSWVKSPVMSTLLTNARMYHITYILTIQYPMGIRPELRGNFDYVYLLADDTVSNQRRIYDHYAGMFPNFDAFRQVFEQLTPDYGAMVINNRGVRENFLDKIFYYKAKINANSYTNSESHNYLLEGSENNEISETDSDTLITDTDSDYSEELCMDDLANLLDQPCPSSIPIQNKHLINIYRPCGIDTIKTTKNHPQDPKIVLLKEYNFRNLQRIPIFLIHGKTHKERNVIIKKILNHYYPANKEKVMGDIAHLKANFDYELLSQITKNQENNNKIKHFVVFDDCCDQFDSYPNKKKCALYELFLRYDELRIPIILQLDDSVSSCPTWIKKEIDHILLNSETTNQEQLYTASFCDILPTDKFHALKSICNQTKNDSLALVVKITSDSKNSSIQYLSLEDNYCFDEKSSDKSSSEYVDLDK